MAERLTLTQNVVGSNPATPARRLAEKGFPVGGEQTSNPEPSGDSDCESNVRAVRFSIIFTELV